MISIALTTYNGEKYLAEQLSSISRQTYKDWELVVCDDCSSDNTIKILEEFKKSNPQNNISLITNEKKLGPKKNFEKTISLCSGEYTALCDQDDIWEENHLELLLNSIGSRNLVCGDAMLFDENGPYQKFSDSNCFSPLFFDSNPKKLKKILYSGGCFQGASFLGKTDYLKSLCPIPEEIPAHDLWFVFNAICENSFIYLDRVVTNYRQHSGQETRKEGSLYSASFKLFPQKRIIPVLFAKKESFSKEVQDILTEVLFFYKAENNMQNIIRKNSIWIKNYKFAYLPHSVIKFLPRLVKFNIKLYKGDCFND